MYRSAPILVFTVIYLWISLIASQNMTLYSLEDCAGYFARFAEEDISSFDGFENKALSVKLNGPWLFYEYANYNKDENGTVETISSVTYGCKNFMELNSTASSARIITGTNELRLYTNETYQGWESTISNEAPRLLNSTFMSLIMTGSSPWTLYGETNYTGVMLCIFPQSDSSVTYVPDTMVMGIPIEYEFIKSVQIGCVMKKTDRNQMQKEED